MKSKALLALCVLALISMPSLVFSGAIGDPDGEHECIGDDGLCECRKINGWNKCLQGTACSAEIGECFSSHITATCRCTVKTDGEQPAE